ncbi:MAG: Lipopolysaccharide export system protein LptA [uncultured Thiotrichaceae bacterium]|uniref:Lipopolysaccharide export system protein LptA n=1 Tax=uncultured Thiotrichaceae bacterium TaxID=298394 RepID=A0A6S6T4Z1_9GAMM|nr:MAG: Lipopolysaccharide export system protein LptA [uncultured Thiotrichaceae bacterium]
MQNIYQIIKLVGKAGLILCCLLGTSSTFALSSDIKQPVKIDADSVSFNKAKGYAVYEGNVSIQQGTLKIKATKIEIFAPDNNIDRIVAKGSPVSFQQTMDDGKLAIGKANNVQYKVKAKQLTLSGDASLSQDKDAFSSPNIVYSIATGELKAGGAPTGSNKKPGRVKAIFYPTN